MNLLAITSLGAAQSESPGDPIIISFSKSIESELSIAPLDKSCTKTDDKINLRATGKTYFRVSKQGFIECNNPVAEVNSKDFKSPLGFVGLYAHYNLFTVMGREDLVAATSTKTPWLDTMKRSNWALYEKFKQESPATKARFSKWRRDLAAVIHETNDAGEQLLSFVVIFTGDERQRVSQYDFIKENGTFLFRGTIHGGITDKSTKSPIAANLSRALSECIDRKADVVSVSSI